MSFQCTRGFDRRSYVRFREGIYVAFQSPIFWTLMCWCLQLCPLHGFGFQWRWISKHAEFSAYLLLIAVDIGPYRGQKNYPSLIYRVCSKSWDSYPSNPSGFPSSCHWWVPCCHCSNLFWMPARSPKMWGWDSACSILEKRRLVSQPPIFQG